MKFLQKHFSAFSVAVLVLLALPAARASEWDKRTVITVNGQIQVPNKTLDAGTYVFKLLDSPSNRNIVQIFDQNEQHLITTILALPNYRLQPTGKTVFTFWETPEGTPPAVRAWFYPGDNYGQEFVYPKNVAFQTVAAAAPPPPAPVAEEPAPPPPPPPPAAEPEPAPAPEPAPEATAPQAPAEPQAQPPAPAPQDQTTPDNTELPKTASPVPLIGLLGLGSLAGFFALRRATR
jgi:hypothetical protein